MDNSNMVSSMKMHHDMAEDQAHDCCDGVDISAHDCASQSHCLDNQHCSQGAPHFSAVPTKGTVFKVVPWYSPHPIDPLAIKGRDISPELKPPRA